MNRIAVNRDIKRIQMRNTKKKIAAHQTSHDPLFGLWGHASKSRQLNGGVRLSQPGWENLRFGWVNDWDAAKSGTLPPTT